MAPGPDWYATSLFCTSMSQTHDRQMKDWQQKEQKS